MRIVTWNCQSGLRKKTAALLALDPDLAIVPECTQGAAAALTSAGYHQLWFGDPDARGLAVFFKPQFTLKPLGEPVRSWIVPLDVSCAAHFTLIAVWPCQKGGGISGYVKLLRDAFAEHADWFGHGPVVVAGDFNSNAQFDITSDRNHASLVSFLSKQGLVSAYHSHFQEEQGAETRPTFYMNRMQDEPFHVDYIFLPRAWMSSVTSVEVGTFAQWAALSDHRPLTVDLAPTA